MRHVWNFMESDYWINVLKSVITQIVIISTVQQLSRTCTSLSDVHGLFTQPHTKLDDSFYCRSRDVITGQYPFAFFQLPAPGSWLVTEAEVPLVSLVRISQTEPAFFLKSHHLSSLTLLAVVLGTYTWQTSFSMQDKISAVGWALLPRFASEVMVSSFASFKAFHQVAFFLTVEITWTSAPLKEWRPGNASTFVLLRALHSMFQIDTSLATTITSNKMHIIAELLTSSLKKYKDIGFWRIDIDLWCSMGNSINSVEGHLGVRLFLLAS